VLDRRARVDRECKPDGRTSPAKRAGEGKRGKGNEMLGGPGIQPGRRVPACRCQCRGGRWQHWRGHMDWPQGRRCNRGGMCSCSLATCGPAPRKSPKSSTANPLPVLRWEWTRRWRTTGKVWGLLSSHVQQRRWKLQAGVQRRMPPVYAPRAGGIGSLRPYCRVMFVWWEDSASAGNGVNCRHTRGEMGLVSQCTWETAATLVEERCCSVSRVCMAAWVEFDHNLVLEYVVTVQTDNSRVPYLVRVPEGTVPGTLPGGQGPNST